MQFKEDAERLSYEVGIKKAAQQHSYSATGKTQREIELERDNAELRRANEKLKGALERPEEVKTWRLFKFIHLRRQRWNVEIMCRGLLV